MLIVAGAWLLAACAMHVGDLHAYGPVWLVTPVDIREAAKVCEASSAFGKHIAYVDVISRDELHFHQGIGLLSYEDVRRVRGKWRYYGFVFVEQF